MGPPADLNQMFDKALGAFLAQCWPFLLLLVALAVLKSFLPRGRSRRTSRKSLKRSRTEPKPKTDEDRDYERRLAGVAGELRVRTLLERRYDNSLHDVYLPSKNGVTQIDHIVVVAGAIVVIETKNYGGLILGDAGNHKWSQIMGKGVAPNSFMNPIHQNAGHVSAVRMALGSGLEIPVVNLVVFVGDGKFGRPLPKNVVSFSSLGSRLEGIGNAHPTSGAVKEAWPILCGSCLAKPRTVLEAEHLETLERRTGKLRRRAG